MGSRLLPFEVTIKKKNEWLFMLQRGRTWFGLQCVFFAPKSHIGLESWGEVKKLPESEHAGLFGRTESSLGPPSSAPYWGLSRTIQTGAFIKCDCKFICYPVDPDWLLWSDSEASLAVFQWHTSACFQWRGSLSSLQLQLPWLPM